MLSNQIQLKLALASPKQFWPIKGRGILRRNLGVPLKRKKDP